MRYLLDLDGDWFAMPPLPTPAHYPPDDAAYVAAQPPLAVGDVLANVRTKQCHYNDAGQACCDDAPVWANPPFLRVVEVLPIVMEDHATTHSGAIVVLFRSGECRRWSAGAADTVTPIDLPGAVPGGWAVRVEPIQPNPRPFSLAAILHNASHRPPRPTGSPLNKEALR